ncbi:H-NS histone family protein [Burkholderia metallica]|uniref:H-NS histone family protein n=1 Tax=Burkholderia metallica TaxID=488729 RepID=UPI001CF278CA|nr:H-NS histone family protein [Burkholderia metallica]MCA8022750.1 H-NS histone family protein [Burkholderia metallica]
MSTYQTLLAQRAVLETEIQNAKAAARETVLAEVKRMVLEFNLSAREIFGGSKARKHQPARARYRDPETGATWSGRGRPPAWIDGKDRAPFEIAPPPSRS